MIALLQFIRRSFTSISVSRQFLAACVVFLVVAALVVGSWLGREIEHSALNRAASIASVYVESILASQLLNRIDGQAVDDNTRRALDRIFIDGPLRRKVVRFKLWDAEGEIIYSSETSQVGQRFPVEGPLAAAFAGNLQAHASRLDRLDNESERERWARLLEVYVPVRLVAGGPVVAVAEFYHSMENIQRDIRSAQQHSWILVSVSTFALFLLLYGWVRQASNTIIDQQHDLHRQLRQLRASLEENERMRERLRDAGARSTALNEQFLHRIAADLHDGPAQTVAYALMRFEELATTCKADAGAGAAVNDDLSSLKTALQTSLEDLRNIARGLGMPGIAELSLAETANSAIRDFERRSATRVGSEVDPELTDAPLAVKITVYRLVQESLANSWRHAPGGVPHVVLRREQDQAVIEITDHGAGFDPAVAARSGRLGMAFMHERVRLLDGLFEVDSAPGLGTRIRATLPLLSQEMIHA